MPRQKTKGAVGEVFHVYNRGVDKRNIFLDHADYLRFYESLHLFNTEEAMTNLTVARQRERDKKNSLVSIEAYCLLPNHFHLLIRQESENGIGELIKKVSNGYTLYFNEKYKRSGVLFQGTYKRVLVENNEQYQYLFAYVNENHAVHNLKLDTEIMYSSTFHYRKKMKSKLIQKDCDYSPAEGIKLARDIYIKRKQFKKEILES